jgi:hypothetical protein
MDYLDDCLLNRFVGSVNGQNSKVHVSPALHFSDRSGERFATHQADLKIEAFLCVAQ